MLTSIDIKFIFHSAYVYRQGLFSSAGSPNSRCPSSCLVAVYAVFLAIRSPISFLSTE